MNQHNMNAWQIFLAAGPLMWPILLSSIFALAIIIEKVWFLGAIKIDMQDFLAALLDKMRRQQVKEALEICDKTKSPVAAILKAGILKYDRPRQQISEAIEDASLYQIPHLEKNVPLLAMIANTAPLLGFLGTVTGMIRCFQVIEVKAGSAYMVSPGGLAGGIWEALLVTAAGLVVAIPAFIAYNYFVNRINEYIRDMERVSHELVNALTE